MYEKSAKGWQKHLDFILLDLLAMQLAIFIATCIRFGGLHFNRQSYLYQIFLMLILQVAVSFFTEPFKNILKRGQIDEGFAVVKHTIALMIASMAMMYMGKTSQTVSRIIFFLTGALFAIFSLAFRLIWKSHLAEISKKHPRRSILMITVSTMLPEVIEGIRQALYSDYHLAGIVLMDEDRTGEMVEGYPIVADAMTVEAYAQKEWVDEVLINYPEGSYVPTRLTDDLTIMGITVHQRLAVAESRQGHIQHVERLGRYSVLTTCVNLVSPREMFLKRCLDLCGGIVGCLICLIFIITIGPIIYIQSPGPIFFSQYRIGQNGHKFKIYKFRSMYMDAEERKKKLMEQNKISSGLMFKMDDDPRIIGGKKGIGGFIRRFSIDEFPQFYNVLLGDMSLVGTRPPTVDEWEQYEKHHRIRLAIRPGITGMWQVSGRSDITDFEEVVRLDQQYIETWSIGLDIRILLKTVKAVFHSDGAV